MHMMQETTHFADFIISSGMATKKTDNVLMAQEKEKKSKFTVGLLMAERAHSF